MHTSEIFSVNRGHVTPKLRAQGGFAPTLIIFVGFVLTVAIASVVYLKLNPGLPSQKQTTPTHSIPQTTSTPTDETEDWTTYTNTQYGYSFDYPKEKFALINPHPENREARSRNASVRYCGSIPLDDCAEADLPNNHFWVNVLDNPQELGLEDGLASSVHGPLYSEEYCFFRDPRTIRRREKFLGLDAIMYRYTIDQSSLEGVCNDWVDGTIGEIKQIFVHKGDYIFAIYLQAYNPGEDDGTLKAFSAFDQILSTFKFTEDSAKSLCCEVAPPRDPCDINEDGRCDIADFDKFKLSLWKEGRRSRLQLIC